MKVLTPLLLALSLALGTIAAMTAYLPRLDVAARAVAAGVELELGAPSGKVVGPDGAATAIAQPGERLTPELIERLRAAGVERVKVRQFSFTRWSHGWLFALSCAGLAVGAVLVRRERRRALAASAAAPHAAGGSPEAALQAVRATLERLAAELPVLRQSPDAGHRLTAALGELQTTHLDAILQARERLIAAGGLGGFAAFMSAFSVLERQVNRAWSAAADDALGEVADCLQRALVLVDETARLLPRS